MWVENTGAPAGYRDKAEFVVTDSDRAGPGRRLSIAIQGRDVFGPPTRHDRRHGVSPPTAPDAPRRTAESGSTKREGRCQVSQSQGRPLRLSHADIVRWRAQLLVTGTCHVWMGAVGSDGYGRIAIRNAEDGARTLTPHQVGARLGYGPIPAGATVLHHCEVRLCCRAAPGHLRVGTQSENMRQAVARGRAVGPHPGLVDVRGKAGASRAIQAALRDATGRSPSALAAVLAAVIADGDPLRDLHPLFDLPAYPAPAPPAVVGAVPGVAVLVSPRRRAPAGSLPLFDA